MRILQSVGKSLTFEQSVREAIELQRNYRCKNPVCETQVWKLRHELDMAQLNISRLKRLLRYQTLPPTSSPGHNGRRGHYVLNLSVHSSVRPSVMRL